MAVLLVNDYWKRNDRSRQTVNHINTNLAQKLYKRGVETYSTTLALTEQEDDLKHARTKGVIIIQPRPTKRMKVPDMAWLCEYHDKHFPDLPTDIGYLVGFSATTLEAASVLKDERYPDAKLFIINTIKPQQAEEDGQHDSDQYSFYNNVDVVFSYGQKTHAGFLSLKQQENLPPEAQVYDEVEIITALCEEVGGVETTLSKSWEDIKMKDVASAGFASVVAETQDNPRDMSTESKTRTTQPSRQQLLGNNFSNLMRNMDGKHVLKYLVQDGILSIDKQREMREEAGSKRQELNGAILEEISRGGEHAVRCLSSALRQDDIKQGYLAEVLEPKAQTPGASPRGAQVQWQPPYNIVLLGRTGSGKSATGNSIVGSIVFEESDMALSKTKICDNAKVCINGCILNVIDTPGFADTNVPHETVLEEISKVHLLAHSGIHAIILVFRFPPRLTEEERKAYDSLIQMFRQDIHKHVIILYTYGDDFEKKAKKHKYTLEDYVLSDEQPKWFKELLRQVDHRYLIFDNDTEDPFKRESQRCKLLQVILEVMAGTKNQPYNNKYTKMASKFCEEEQLVLEDEKKHRETPECASKSEDELIEESKATEQTATGITPTGMSQLAERVKKKLPKKKKSRGRGQQQGESTMIELSQGVNGKSVAVLGDDDPKASGDWTVVRPRLRRNNPTEVQMQSPLSSNATGESLKQQLQDVATCVISKSVENASAASAASGDVGNRTPSSQPEPQQFNTNPVYNEIELEIHQKFDELMNLVKQNEGHGQVVVEKMKIEVEKDAKKDCFPASSVVVTESTGEANEVPFHSVSVEDRVKVSAGGFQPVFLFSHAVEDVLSTYIVITTEGGKTVSLSQSHVIHVIKDEKRVSVTARDVTEGDTVFCVEDSTESLVPDKVINVATALKSGQYCPHTYSGALIVDGVYVSCYTDKLPPRLAHGLLLPLGWLHRICPGLFWLMCAPGENNGAPWWMGKLDDVLTWWKSR